MATGGWWSFLRSFCFPLWLFSLLPCNNLKGAPGNDVHNYYVVTGLLSLANGSFRDVYTVSTGFGKCGLVWFGLYKFYSWCVVCVLLIWSRGDVGLGSDFVGSFGLGWSTTLYCSVWYRTSLSLLRCFRRLLVFSCVNNHQSSATSWYTIT